MKKTVTVYLVGDMPIKFNTMQSQQIEEQLKGASENVLRSMTLTVQDENEKVMIFMDKVSAIQIREVL